MLCFGVEITGFGFGVWLKAFSFCFCGLGSLFERIQSEHLSSVYRGLGSWGPRPQLFRPSTLATRTAQHACFLIYGADGPGTGWPRLSKSKMGDLF